MSRLQTFLLCQSCEVLYPLDLTEIDLPEAEAQASAEDLHVFRCEHRGHELEVVRRLPGASTYDRPAWDPMATEWFQVTSGHGTRLVRSWRDSIDEPRKRQMQPGPIPAEHSSVEVDLALLRRALDRHFFPHALRARKLEEFVILVQALVQDLDPSSLEISFDDVEHANASFGPFPDDLCDLLLAQSRSIFDESELQRVAEFIDSNRSAVGALAVRVYIYRQLAALTA
jgi:hypothetical protein